MKIGGAVVAAIDGVMRQAAGDRVFHTLVFFAASCYAREAVVFQRFFSLWDRNMNGPLPTRRFFPFGLLLVTTFLLGVFLDRSGWLPGSFDREPAGLGHTFAPSGKPGIWFTNATLIKKASSRSK